ncbi:helix-turn-helix domain-containing protein [Bradyrhizobium diazoefficiens]|uniref:helix-turn-helix domain-containing protein n=1 Tax=Bradyrhizobium diazoefficiens TaxID=1355477 RepID=UPI001AEE8F59|nr:helix-turn-helix domain-containing protein [Bradyrhizobium diazoefficiens]
MLRQIVENPTAAKVGRPTDYTPEVGNQVIALMASGLSLTAAAGALGVARSTIHRWIEQHQEFSDSVAIGKAKRVYTLETQMLDSDESAVINARRFALVNAAPEEWREKQAVDLDVPTDSPIRMLANQLMGTAIRPQLPEPKVIEHDANEMRVFRPQAQPIPDESVTVIEAAVVDTIATEPEAEPLEPSKPLDRMEEAPDEEAPRIHTISRFFEEDDDGAQT